MSTTHGSGATPGCASTISVTAPERDVRGRWEAARAERAKTREAERARMTLGQRLDRALTAIELGHGVQARAIGSAPRSSEDGGRVPRAASGADVSRHETLILHHVQAIEIALDAELGLIRSPVVGDRPGATGSMESARLSATEERDRIVWEQCYGVPAEQVAHDAPYLGGSARTIERARVAEAERRGMKVRPSTGEVID